MTFIDLFAGIGGFRRGLELAGHKCMGYCEWDKYASMSYRSMHTITEEQREYLRTLPLRQRQKEILKEEYLNGEWYSNDIRNVDSTSIPKVDCWTFGAPCQDFSVAGKRAGLNGDRSSLIREVFRILEELKEEDRPEWLIYENVKGMLSSNNGLDYMSILCSMDEGGYDIEWQNINSAWFVPQNRERIYTIGHLRRCGRSKILPIEATDGENRVSIIRHRDGYRRNMQTYTSDGITEALDTACGGNREFHVAEPIHNNLAFIDMHRGGGMTLMDKANTIKARYDSGVSNFAHDNTGVAVPISIGNVHPSGHGMSGEIYSSDGLSATLTTNKGQGQNVAIPVLTPDRAEKRQNGRRFKEDGEPSFTLTAQDKHGVGINPLGVLKNVRSDYGKEIRKEYESGELDISRHEFLEHEIREDGISNTISTVQKDNQLAVKIKESVSKGYSECRIGGSVNLAFPNSATRRGMVQQDMAGTLDCSCNQGIYVQVSDELTVYAIWYEKYQCYIAIRKLTPKECFRLQGWSDDYFEKAEFVNSNSQLYKQAGNGVTVDVVRAIGEKIRSYIKCKSETR